MTHSSPDVFVSPLLPPPATLRGSIAGRNGREVAPSAELQYSSSLDTISQNSPQPLYSSSSLPASLRDAKPLSPDPADIMTQDPLTRRLEERQELIIDCHRNLLQRHRVILQSFIVLEVASHVFRLYPHTSQLAATLSDGVDSLIQGLAAYALFHALSSYERAHWTYKRLIEPVELTPTQPYSPTGKELEAGTAPHHRAAADEAQTDVDVAATSPAPPSPTCTLPPDATHAAVFLLLRLTTLCFFWILTTRALSWNKSLCENTIAAFWYLHGAYSRAWVVCIILGVWGSFAPAWPVFTMKDVRSGKKKQKTEAYAEKA